MSDQQQWGALRSELNRARPDVVRVVRIIQGFDRRDEAVVYAFESLRRRGMTEEAGVVAGQHPEFQTAMLGVRKSINALAKFMGTALVPAVQEATRSFAEMARLMEEQEEVRRRIVTHVNPRIGRRHR